MKTDFDDLASDIDEDPYLVFTTVAKLFEEIEEPLLSHFGWDQLARGILQQLEDDMVAQHDIDVLAAELSEHSSARENPQNEHIREIVGAAHRFVMAGDLKSVSDLRAAFINANVVGGSEIQLDGLLTGLDCDHG